MAPIPLSHSLPLPRSWPRRVRSAAVHAISLADLAFTRTLSWAADSPNPRLRVQAELERLHRQISLLREKIRIKDTRSGIPGGGFMTVEQQPMHLISDQGTQLGAKAFKRWCRRRSIRHRFGAVGKYGSLAVIERCIRTLKTECTRALILVPFRLAAFRNELALYFSWYNGYRPHTWLGGATPDEVYHGRLWACRLPRFEPRPRWPRRSRCASPRTLVRGQPGARLELDIDHHAGRRHLPTFTLRRAA